MELLVIAGLAAVSGNFDAVAGPFAGSWLASLAAVALRAGLAGLHPGVAALLRSAPRIQYLQFGALLALCIDHLRFADHVALP